MSYPPPTPQYGDAPVPPPPPQQPVVKSKATPVIAIILGVVLLLCLGCAGAFAYFTWWANDKVNEIVDNIPTDFPTDAPKNQTGSHKVRYEVNGTGKTLITWARGSGGQDSETVDLPWSKEITVDRANFGVSVSAFPREKDTALQNCKISIDGTERKSAVFTNNVLYCAHTYVTQ